jgi:golgi-specific brefeldin A-resistance guanine nucleotide exchange factor 1
MKISHLLHFQYDNSDGLSKSFNELKDALLNIEDLKAIAPDVFLTPFLEIITSEGTTGQVTAIALSAVNKFLSYGLIGEHCDMNSKIITLK